MAEILKQVKAGKFNPAEADNITAMEKAMAWMASMASCFSNMDVDSETSGAKSPQGSEADTGKQSKPRPRDPASAKRMASQCMPSQEDLAKLFSDADLDAGAKRQRLEEFMVKAAAAGAGGTGLRRRCEA